MPFQCAADETSTQCNQPFGMCVSFVNYPTSACSLVRLSPVPCLLVTVWAAPIVRHVPLGVVLDLAHQHLAQGGNTKNVLSCKQAESLGVYCFGSSECGRMGGGGGVMRKKW